MTWIEHTAVGAGAWGLSKLIRRPLSLSLVLVGSTVMMDLDHLWFRLAAASVLKTHPSISLGFWLNSGTWTHSLAYAIGTSWAVSRLFVEKDAAFRSFATGALLHLFGDWLYRQLLFDMGLLWLWPFATTLF